jgi:DNA-binding XRE family transcriptional regulator
MVDTNADGRTVEEAADQQWENRGQLLTSGHLRSHYLSRVAGHQGGMSGMLHSIDGRRRRRWPKGTWMRLQSGEILRAFMRQRGISERTLARYSGCSRAMIGHLLHERKTTCTPELAVKIAEALSVPLEALFAPRLPSSSVQKAQRTHAGAAA